MNEHQHRVRVVDDEQLQRFKNLEVHERYCRYCNRELFLRDGRKPRAWLFNPPPPNIVKDVRKVLFDDDRFHKVTFVFCDEGCHQAYLSWERS